MGSVAYLLDTHTFLWAVQEDWKLSDIAHKAIENTNIQLFISAISAYEISNKYRLGKLPGYAYIIENYQEIVQKLGVEHL